MGITRTTREAAFTACWNQRAKLVKRLERQENKPTVDQCVTMNTKRQINELDTAINELRY